MIRFVNTDIWCVVVGLEWSYLVVVFGWFCNGPAIFDVSETSITGSLDTLFCPGASASLVELVADCGGSLPEVTCSCCTDCCEDASGDCQPNTPP